LYFRKGISKFFSIVFRCKPTPRAKTRKKPPNSFAGGRFNQIYCLKNPFSSQKKSKIGCFPLREREIGKFFAKNWQEIKLQIYCLKIGVFPLREREIGKFFAENWQEKEKFKFIVQKSANSLLKIGGFPPRERGIGKFFAKNWQEKEKLKFIV
jgi:hypothetical protein